MLFGRRSFLVVGRVGSRESVSCSISGTGFGPFASSSGKAGDTGSGTVRAAGGKGAGLEGGSRIMFSAL
jgi:hypothetical protein